MGVAELAGRWLRARRALRREDQIFAERLAEMAKRHASEGFSAFDDPLEAAVFSVLIEILKELDGDVDP
jgi:predicted Zn-dependent protease